MSKKIILLDEDRDDWTLVKDSLNELGIEASILYFSNSNELFHYLQTEEKPAFIMADYNAVPENGLEVLQRLKASTDWQDIPVFILSESNNETYRSACYRHGASAYIKKPDTHEGTLKKIGTFFRYWFDVVEA